MPDTPPVFTDKIQWPEGMDEHIFLDQYWQKKPLLIRQAFPEFETPLPPDELAGLSLEPDTTGRIITQDNNGGYHLEHGPFDDDRFTQLTGNQWSLLVTDVEKHLPEFIAYLQPFRFIPDWRIDDLMISYAPDGASVGAHVDQYDVFLLQGSGVRQWSIDADSTTKHLMRKDGDLKIIANFKATDTWNLEAGDMLYLPPDIAHHGVAKGDDCTTWSIGFRAPLLSDLITGLAESLGEKIEPKRYTDDALSPAQCGEISTATIQRFKAIWNQATQVSDAEFAQLLGCWLSEPSIAAPDSELEPRSDDILSGANLLTLRKAPFSRFAWVARSDNAACLFADGGSIECTVGFAKLICASVQYVEFTTKQLNDVDSSALKTLISMDCLQLEH